MARLKDERKRMVILDSSKMLFAKDGFFKTSISDIVKETGLPIGTIYTYFKSKEEIISTIVETGWTELYSKLNDMMKEADQPAHRLKTLLDKFLPTLLKDIDFITILLTEALVHTRVEEKFDKLSAMIFELLSTTPGSTARMDRKSLSTAVTVFFMGILGATKLSKSSSIGISTEDIIGFTRYSVEQALNIKL